MLIHDPQCAQHVVCNNFACYVSVSVEKVHVSICAVIDVKATVMLKCFNLGRFSAWCYTIAIVVAKSVVRTSYG
jgi:hypothetical protein